MFSQLPAEDEIEQLIGESDEREKRCVSLTSHTTTTHFVPSSKWREIAASVIVAKAAHSLNPSLSFDNTPSSPLNPHPSPAICILLPISRHPKFQHSLTASFLFFIARLSAFAGCVNMLNL